MCNYDLYIPRTDSDEYYGWYPGTGNWLIFILRTRNNPDNEFRIAVAFEINNKSVYVGCMYSSSDKGWVKVS